MNHLRAKMKRPNPPFTINLMPMEMEYVDDCDFISENKNEREEMLPMIEKIFKEWNLKINPTKTEYVNYQLSENTNEKGKEPWRKAITLGSCACTTEEIKRRINLSNVAYGKFAKIWGSQNLISEDTKI